MNSLLKPRPRCRELGLRPGALPVGPRNLISDVPGVTVGHVTRWEGDDIRTGVTLIDPGIEGLFRTKLPAAVAVGNGFGKLIGSTQIAELGTLETPIALTNTLALGPVLQGLVGLVQHLTPDLQPTETINGVVGETNDGILNNIQRLAIRPEDVREAYERRSAAFDLGCIGAGTGTRAFRWKGGVGSASRVVHGEGGSYTVGAFLQVNFGGSFTLLGVPVEQHLAAPVASLRSPDGSCMIVLATDAPVTARQLGRLARRAPLGLARTGSVMAHGSGDYAIAFSTSRVGLEGSGEVGRCLREDHLTDLFSAVVEAVEESVYDALFTATTVSGRDGNVLEALPVEAALDLLRAHGR